MHDSVVESASIYPARHYARPVRLKRPETPTKNETTCSIYVILRQTSQERVQRIYCWVSKTPHGGYEGISFWVGSLSDDCEMHQGYATKGPRNQIVKHRHRAK